MKSNERADLRFKRSNALPAQNVETPWDCLLSEEGSSLLRPIKSYTTIHGSLPGQWQVFMDRQNKMSRDQITYRIRDLLPVFGHESSSTRERCQNLALVLGETVSDVEDFTTYDGDRMISAESYWSLVKEYVLRRNRLSIGNWEGNYLIFDRARRPILRAKSAQIAAFLSDVEQGHYMRRWSTDAVGMLLLDDAACRRSRLRRILATGRFPSEHVCDLLNVDHHGLIDYQIECVAWAVAPTEEFLKDLEGILAAIG